MGKLMPKEPRDRLVNHVDNYINNSPRAGRFVATFEHCGVSMIEIPTHIILSIGLDPATEGIAATLRCAPCGLSLDITIRPSSIQPEKKKDEHNR